MVSVSRHGAVSDYRNKNVNGAIAGIYNPCRTILNEHRPVCSYEASFYGKYLDVTDNPDVWFPLVDAGSIAYSSKVLTMTTATGAATETRAVINTYAYPITGNFIEATFKIVSMTTGAGGTRNTFFGFASALSAFPATERAGFQLDDSGVCYLVYRGGSKLLSECPIGRSLQGGDIITVRLDRQEGSSNIDITRWYINGQKQFESTAIPQANVYAGLGVYCDASCSTARAVGIDYFGFRWVP